MSPISSTYHGMFRSGLALAMLLGASVLLSACNTTAGAGQDVSAVGRGVTTTADKVKQGL